MDVPRWEDGKGGAAAAAAAAGDPQDAIDGGIQGVRATSMDRIELFLLALRRLVVLSSWSISLLRSDARIGDASLKFFYFF